MEQAESYYQPYANVFEMLELIGLAFLVIIVLETLWDFMFGKRKKVGETIANFAIAVVGFLLERSAYGLVFIVGLYLSLPSPSLKFPLPGGVGRWPCSQRTLAITGCIDGSMRFDFYGLIIVFIIPQPNSI
jgi:hypothetical protein